MATGLGKREEHKIATRHAIQSAADALFDSRGYADTTIRDIADAAGVTERTFFRYFSGKESLLVRDIEEMLPILGADIRRRPAGEDPLDAVEKSFLSMFDRLRETRPNLSWLFHDGPPGPKLAKSTPGLLLQFEQEIIDALVDRMGRDEHQPRSEFAAQVLARCAVAALRSAGIRYWQLGQGSDERPSEVELIREAFAVLRGSENRQPPVRGG
ncbi:TetR/AcrR family transcriptional regulator [Mycobacterium sp. CVI_P3]|uniref:TetR/AcrR family transcriptional regulator n=1 Tax=Mycobacterium pinniadriaticum TaxID=2994102 RepID=A0ABT3S8G7_9MYCO|nr:TetR/AcrR family transcriptional regulator [Mycobacterium pinniadriaticum]MCX2929370.1 TetR/AcrR family transcriptional regulator [Mycobacterium pinniadriaticum]MCX2935794.1 TetR/AcrR family transcriptional regulator [Mycobacterium pinniadriaticum]